MVDGRVESRGRDVSRCAMCRHGLEWTAWGEVCTGCGARVLVERLTGSSLRWFVIAVHVLLVALPISMIVWSIPRGTVDALEAVVAGQSMRTWLVIAGMSMTVGAVLVLEVLLEDYGPGESLQGVDLTVRAVVGMVVMVCLMWRLLGREVMNMPGSAPRIRDVLFTLSGLLWLLYAMHMIAACAYGVKLERASGMIRRLKWPTAIVIGSVSVIALYGDLVRRLIHPELYNVTGHATPSIEAVRWDGRLGDVVAIADQLVSMLVGVVAVCVFGVLLRVRGRLARSRGGSVLIRRTVRDGEE